MNLAKVITRNNQEIEGDWLEENGEVYKKEANVKGHLTDPFIEQWGWDIRSRHEVRYEYPPNAYRGTLCDIAFIDENKNPVLIMELKRVHDNKPLDRHLDQVMYYFQSKESIKVAILTNMVDMYFYSDLKSTNMMDDEPFYKIHFPTITEEDLKFLSLFDKELYLNKPDELRSYFIKVKKARGTTAEDLEKSNGMDKETMIQILQGNNPLPPIPECLEVEKSVAPKTETEPGNTIEDKIQIKEDKIEEHEPNNEEGQEEYKEDKKGNPTRKNRPMPKITFLGDSIEARNRGEFYRNFLEIMNQLEPQKMSEIVDWFPNNDKAVRFSKDKEAFSESFGKRVDRLSTQIYFTFGLVEEKIIENCRTILEYFGYPQDELKVIPAAQPPHEQTSIPTTN